MQRMLPVAAVRVVSAVSDGLRIEDSVEDDSGIIDEDVGVDSVDLEDDESDSDSEGSVPISARVARFLDSGKPAGPRKRKRAKLNHLSSEQKVERRKILNRIAAQTARDRKKVQMDELEQFVKELASENLRLARENAELRQKSTEFESENAKLRTQLERSGHPRTSTLKQEPMSIVQYTADSLKDSDSKPVSLIGARPVGIAARVGDANVKMAESADTSIELGWTSDSRAVLNRSQAEAKRSRLAATTECNKVTQNGVSEAVQRNAAAVCAITLQQYSFAHRAQALFNVLFVLLVVGFRSVLPCLGLLMGHSARNFRLAVTSPQVVRSLIVLKATRVVSETETGPPGPIDKLQRWLVALVACRIVRIAAQLEATSHHKLQDDVHTPATAACMLLQHLRSRLTIKSSAFHSTMILRSLATVTAAC